MTGLDNEITCTCGMILSVMMLICHNFRVTLFLVSHKYWIDSEVRSFPSL